MFDLHKQTRRSINLETSKGNPIDNYQIDELTKMEINQFAKFKGKFPIVTMKGQPTPIYNCHGLTFASRRTNIDATSELRKILIEDSYVRVDTKDVLPGDIVLYIDNTGSGEIIHTGMVIHLDIRPPLCITVLSKWGKYKEVVHVLHDCPYPNSFHEFYRNNHGYTEV